MKSQTDRPPSKRNDYILLNTPRAEIFVVIEEICLAKHHLQMRGPKSKRDSKLFCLLHKDVYHGAEDCIKLAEEIEKLIERGYVK